MRRDEQSKHNRYSSLSYLNTLGKGLVEQYTSEIFVQDNAPIYTSHLVHNTLSYWGITVLANWPPYSPDLNPIEHLWPRLKEAIYDLRPNLDSITNKDEQQVVLNGVLPRAWLQIPVDVINKVLDSMPKRLQAVIDAQGWHTKY